MTTPLTKSLLPVAIALSALLCSACLERTEVITVRPDGSVILEAEFRGDATILETPIALPSEPVWTILERSIDSTREKPELHLKAAMSIPYGKPLPRTYAGVDARNPELNLHFPSEISVRTEGNRTFYEFRRTYQARGSLAYDITETPLFWDDELESRVFDSGLINLNESEQRQYLEQLTAAFGAQHWRFNRNALAELVRAGQLDPGTMNSIAAEAAEHFENTITTDFMFSIMQQGDEEIALTLDSLEDAIADYFQARLAETIGASNQTTLDQYDNALARVRRDYRITEVLNGHEFSVTLKMPGTIIHTNGLLEPEEPGQVVWLFDGKKLHDADIPLYAVSVVMK